MPDKWNAWAEVLGQFAGKKGNDFFLFITCCYYYVATSFLVNFAPFCGSNPIPVSPNRDVPASFQIPYQSPLSAT